MRRIPIVVGIALVAALPLAADHHEAPTESEAGAQSLYSKTLAANFEFVSGQLMQLAEALPEEVYSWRPSDEVRSTSEVFMHVVGANMMMPVMFGSAPAEGFEMPENPFALARELEAKVTVKADVIAKLAESIDYAKGAIAGYPEEMLDGELQMFGPQMTNRDGLLVLLSHSHEHLGQLIAYARSNGVKPPWSQPMPESMPEPADMEQGER